MRREADHKSQFTTQPNAAGPITWAESLGVCCLVFVPLHTLDADFARAAPWGPDRCRSTARSGRQRGDATRDRSASDVAICSTP